MIGKIPKDWDMQMTKELGEVVTGITPSTLTKEYWAGEYPFVTPTDITDSKYVERTERKVTAKGLERGRLIPRDSVLVTCIASIGKMALAFEDCLTNQQINSVICKKGVNPHYVYYALGFRANILKNWAGRTTNPIIKKSLFEKFPISIPKSELEQQNIAEVLGVVDLAVSKAGEVIAKTERLKKGLIQELLTKGIGHKEYKQTPIGKIPKNWEFVRIKELGELQYGYTTSAAQENTGIKFLRITDIKEDESVNWEQVPYCHIGGNEFDKYALREGDLLFARIGATAGKTTYIGQKVRGIFASYLIRLKTIKEHVHPPFVFYFTQSATYWSQALRQREGQLKKGINATMLSKFMVPLPSFEEQQRIAEILSAVDHKLKLERKEKTKLERVKRGLMDLLLTGKVRVKV